LLQVEMAVADARQDLVAEGADVAIRLGKLGDSGFGARKLETLETMLVASPLYLKARGTPKTPADLASHDCIFGPGNFGRDSWSHSPATVLKHRARPHSHQFRPGRLRQRHGRTWYRHGLDGHVRG
jgi:DNA-binding transcriptional LysR family regulator